jgi:hypothetical protein
MSFAVSAHRLDTANQSSTLLIYYIDEDGEVVNFLSLPSGLSYYNQLSPLTMLADSSFIVGLNLGGGLDLNGTKLLRHIRYEGGIISTHTAWDYGRWVDLKLHPGGNIVALSKAFSGSWNNREQHGMRTTMYTPGLDTL